MKRTRFAYARALAIALAVGFAGGAATAVWFGWHLPGRSPRSLVGLADDCGPGPIEVRPSAANDRDRPALARNPPREAPDVVVPVLTGDPIAALRDRHLTLPVQGVDRSDLVTSFSQKRGSDRLHEAIDILAPRGTPVLAVEDGSIAKLFHSQAGGLTVYQFDPTSSFAYYYAHLDSYASGLKEGDRVTRGQVLGYVGTSGNAPRDTPHLHFAIFRLTDKKQWWQGQAIDPYDVFK
jgi:murein DD-endopeptidase MepM/ murein hydrolase activator NlpD